MTTNNKQAIATIRKHTIHYSEKNEKKKQKAVETVKIKKNTKTPFTKSVKKQLSQQPYIHMNRYGKLFSTQD